MKRMSLFLGFCFIFLECHPQWFRHTSIPVSTNLSAVTFPDPKNGWIIGAAGTILHTSDGGTTWEQQISLTTKNLTRISMADSLHGWISGSNNESPYGAILRTEDGGGTWELADSSDFLLSDVFFLDTLNGWAVGSNHDVPGPSVVKITRDGGDTWTDLLLSEITFPNEVFFVDPQVGYIGGTDHSTDHFRMKILKTTDGGLTWNSFIDWGTDGDMFFNDMMFLDSLTGWIAGYYYAIEIGGGGNDNGFIAKIENGSAGSYNYIYNDWWKPRAIFFTTSDSGWAVGQSGLFMDTRDDGENWTIQHLPPGQLMNDIFFTDKNHGWAVGNGGTVMYTNNNGYTGISDFERYGDGGLELEIYPNPALSVTEFSYTLPGTSYVQVSVYDLSGREVISLVKSHQDKGMHKLNADVSRLGPGVYNIRLQAGQYSSCGKMVVVR